MESGDPIGRIRSIRWCLLTVSAALAAGFVTGACTETSTTEPGPAPHRLALPLANDPSALMLARHDRDLLVGIAARPGGPVEVAALRAETPLGTDALDFRSGSRTIEAKPCGAGCSRLDEDVLRGTPSTIAVQSAGSTLVFRLPARLPPLGTKLFAHLQRTMKALRSFRYTERLSSGSAVIVSDFDVEAPNRLRFRSSTGYRSVIIGRLRWDYHDGRWERTSSPGLRTSELYMWNGASHARLLGRARVDGRPVRVITAFLGKLPAWFRLFVQPNGRVLEADMLAPSHFMRHRFRDFDRPLRIVRP